MATAGQRTHLRGLMTWLVHREPKIHYAQVRPMRTSGLFEQELVDIFAAGMSISTDCSETVTLLCRLAGLKDPNGAGYNGTGNTSTLLNNKHMRHFTDPKMAGSGALVVFGSGYGHHVAMVFSGGTDPMLFSHGSESGPKFVKLSEEAAVQPKPVTFLSIETL